MNIISDIVAVIMDTKWGFTRKSHAPAPFVLPSWQSLLDRGFRSWADAPPPHGNVVEFYRIWNGDSFDADPSDLNPHFNVHGLYWRPVGPMLNITAQRNACG